MDAPAYSNIITVLWIILIGYWIISAGGNKKTAYRYDPGKRLLVLVGFVVFIFVLYKQGGWLRSQLIPEGLATRSAGVLLCATGVAIAIWARYILGRNWSANPTIKEGHELITSGPYRFVRHPIYTGILLALLGTELGNGQARDFVLLAVVAIGLHFKSRIEEKLMMQTFPQTYPEYRRRTKALIPYVL